MSATIEELMQCWAPLNAIACWLPVGSRVTCNPAPTDTDEDHLLLVANPESWMALNADLINHGWVIGGSKPVLVDEHDFSPDEAFTSYTRGHLNLIVTTSLVFFDKFVAATAVARRLNVLDKADRIALFQAVLYGRHTEALHPAYPRLIPVQAAEPEAEDPDNWLDDLL